MTNQSTSYSSHQRYSYHKIQGHASILLLTSLKHYHSLDTALPLTSTTQHSFSFLSLFCLSSKLSRLILSDKVIIRHPFRPGPRLFPVLTLFATSRIHSHGDGSGVASIHRSLIHRRADHAEHFSECLKSIFNSTCQRLNS